MLDPHVLGETQCWFGGGTRIVLELGEYRESKAIDFLCASRAGYAALRGMTTQSSFSDLFSRPPALLREIRADRYGVRTWLEVGGEPIKFEIVAEGRISLAATSIRSVPVDVLDHHSCFAEKLLANSDRGRDRSTLSRDLVDLAAMTATWDVRHLESARADAERVYGAAVRRDLVAALEQRRDPEHRRRCIAELGVDAPRVLARGIRQLENHPATGVG